MALPDSPGNTFVWLALSIPAGGHDSHSDACRGSRSAEIESGVRVVRVVFVMPGVVESHRVRPLGHAVAPGDPGSGSAALDQVNDDLRQF